jgi:hypothetical protein
MGIVTFRTEALLFTSSQDLMSQLQVSYYLYKKKMLAFQLSAMLSLMTHDELANDGALCIIIQM